MDNLSRFYLDMSTNASKAQKFEQATLAQRELMLSEAGVENASDILALDADQLRKTMALSLIAETDSWEGLDNNAGNADNKNNIGNLGLLN